MDYLLGVSYLILAAHLIDAAQHYWRDNETLSAALNMAWALVAAVLGVSMFFSSDWCYCF